ncbi:MAG: uracil-DNA glycosylase [Rickettsiaceae bacterium]|nr:uracil-DNA glycosylase [Rickettsiaceae bacterium]
MQNTRSHKTSIITHKNEILNKIFDTSLINNKDNEMDNNGNISLARKLANEAINLEDLYNKISNFEGCDLKQFAKNTVLCDGNPNAKIMLIGEAPGATEDEKGISFCGESGMLLDMMLNTIGISRKTNAYITNTIFWRPPANRKPTYEEIEICRPFVEKHIAFINPQLIILIGATATTALLKQGESITNLRGNIYLYKNQYLNESIKTTAIFHPAYLLRQPFKKKDTWYDLLKIQDILTKHNI